MFKRLARKLYGDQPTSPTPATDLHQLAIDTLMAKGTPFAAGLAQEIDRGRQRRTGHSEPNETPPPAIQPLSGRSAAQLQQALAEERERYLRAVQKCREEREHQHNEKRTRMEQDRAAMLDQCREAEAGEYDEWLKGHLLAGGQPSHFHNFPTPRMWVATCNLNVVPLYGAASIDGILIPEGLSDDGGDTGHTNLFLMQGYLGRGFHERTAGRAKYAPVYSDTRIA
jgi:hypothetical protein